MALSRRTVTLETLDRTEIRTHGRERRAGPKDAGITVRTVPALVRMLSSEELAMQAGGNAPLSLGYLMVQNTTANRALLGIASLGPSERDKLRAAHITNIGHACSYYVSEVKPMVQRGDEWLEIRIEFSDNSPAR